jgi:hypothetical protein
MELAMTRQAGASLGPNPSIDQVAQRLNQLLQAKHERANGKAAPAPTARDAEPLDVGVHFGVSAARYHQDPALSASDLRRLLVDPVCFWAYSTLNPERLETPDSAAMMRGRAIHSAILQPKFFDKTYAAAPTPADYPGCLVLAEDMRNRCRELGLAVSGSKSELAKRLKTKDPGVVIFDELLAAFEAKCRDEGVEILPASVMQQARDAAQGVQVNPNLAKAFRGGAPEVTVVWTEGDVRFKCRLDYIKPKVVCDLKSISVRERPIDHAIRVAIAEHRYDLQAAHYLRGYRALYAYAFEGCCHGDNPLPTNWARRLAHPDDVRWAWIFLGVDVPLVKGREITASSPVLNRASRELHLAKAQYVDCLQRFGTSAWIDDEPIRPMVEADLAVWMRDPEVL